MTRQIVLIDIGDGMALDGVLPSAVQGGAYSAFVLARGGSAPYTYILTAGEPALTAAGIALDRNTGEVVSSDVLTVGNLPITIRATDITGAWVERSFVIAVVALGAPPPTIMGHLVLRPGAEQNVYQYQITGGTPPYTTSIIAGALPGDMHMVANGTVYGAWEAWTTDFTWTVDVVDAAGQHATLTDSRLHSTTTVYVANSGPSTIEFYDPSPTYGGSIAAGDHPVALAANSSGDTIYCANFGDNTVSFIRLGGAPTDVAAVGSYPMSVCVSNDDAYVYCVNNGDASVSKINAIDTSDVSTFAVGSAPSMIRINPVTGELYIVDYNDSSVYIRDADGAGTLYDYLYVPYATSVCVNSTGTHVFVCGGGGAATLAVFDASTWAQVGSVDLPDASPIALAISRDGRYVFVADNGYSGMRVVDVTNKGAPALIATVDVGGPQAAIAADPNVDDMYVSLGLGGVVTVHATGLFDVSPLGSDGDGGVVVVPT